MIFYLFYKSRYKFASNVSIDFQCFALYQGNAKAILDVTFLQCIWHCAEQVARRLRPSFAAYVNIKVYYFPISISVSDAKLFDLHTRQRTAAAVEPKSRGWQCSPPPLPLRDADLVMAGGRRGREGEVVAFAPLVLQTKPTPTCVRLFLSFFFFFLLARFCRHSRFFLFRSLYSLPSPF